MDVFINAALSAATLYPVQFANVITVSAAPDAVHSLANVA